MPKFLIGRATIDLSVESLEMDDAAAYVGDGTWYFDAMDLLRFADSTMDVGLELDSAREEAVESGKSLESVLEFGEYGLEVHNADDAIHILARMGKAGGNYSVNYESPGSPYWAFHDLDHARNDVNDSGSLFIQGPEEERALINGAILAMDSGVSVADIVRELVKAESEFSQRFGFESKALDNFCHSLESRIKAETVSADR